ncbi:MAG: tRNA guanosine(34) transglycosylase Tgt [bacterium]|nr:tRNA guanosine(34) transglycosylase Tgt [bacterium]
MPFFEPTHTDKNTRARVGEIHTAHGDIQTPAFMPVGTQATVKTLDSADLENIGAQIILGNNYHLHLRPGEDVIDRAGGLHKFMGWDKPILTDSGGFQVFSLGLQKPAQGGPALGGEHDTTQHEKKLVKIDEDGVTFRSHIDGSTHRFTPESAIECQQKIGADIIMAFDECTPDDAPYEYAAEAMERTHRWAERCLKQFKNPTHKLLNSLTHKQFLFGIIQGAKHRDLREASAKFISALDFDGIAVGGESVGYNMEATKEILNWIYPLVPKNKPLYTMGVGLDPADLLEVISEGADMFDCVAPTRLARHGMLYVSPGVSSLTPPARGGVSAQGGRGGGRKHRININNAAFAEDFSPIDSNCSCPVCLPASPRHSSAGATAGKTYTRSYLHHLFNAEEVTALRLASIHNLHFLLNLMSEARSAIKQDKFSELKQKWS